MPDYNPGGETDIVQLDAFQAIRQLSENTVDAAVIDYPWEFDTANGTDRFGHDSATGESELYTTSDENGLRDVLFHTAYAVAPGGWVFVFADDEVYPMFRDLIEQTDGLTRRQTVYWDSENMGMGYYHRVQAYPILTATVGETERYVRDRPNILRAAHHSSSAEYHTQKPVELYRQMLAPPVIEEGEAVLEPFAGTFPSGVVAQERGFNALGWEIRKEALDIARDRLQQSNLAGFQSGVTGE